MPVTLLCPNLSCGHTVTVGDNSRGQVVRCPFCSQQFLVPKAKSKPGTETQEASPATNEGR